jgi:hypothetical protein
MLQPVWIDGWMGGDADTEGGDGRVIPILLLIARSKLVPDFALTIHFVHLLVVGLYSRSIPGSLYWWFIQAASAGLMISLGMWACQWRELQPMAFGGHARAKTEAQSSGGASGEAHVEGEGEGFEMGSSRGRGRDGAGAYQMVEMEGKTGG